MFKQRNLCMPTYNKQKRTIFQIKTINQHVCVLNDQFNELGIFENPKLSKFKLNKKLSGIGKNCNTSQQYFYLV